MCKETKEVSTDVMLNILNKLEQLDEMSLEQVATAVESCLVVQTLMRG